MNKWMKKGLMGLAVTAVSVGASANSFEVKSDSEMQEAMLEQIMIDASDLIAKKMKDRRLGINEEELVLIEEALIDASDLIQKKLKDRMLTPPTQL